MPLDRMWAVPFDPAAVDLVLLELAAPAIGFKIAFEVIVRGRPTLRVAEIPIAFRDRIRGQSKMSFGIALQFRGNELPLQTSPTQFGA